MIEENRHRLPLGLCKQAFMKLDSLISDLHEIKEDEDLTADEKYEFIQMAEVAGIIATRILNIVKKECNEEDFLNEDVRLDEIDMYPEKVESDIFDEPVDE